MRSGKSFANPYLPEDEKRVETLRYKHENGLLYRKYDILTGGEVTTSYIFQEDIDIAPQVGDEVLRCRVIDLGSDNQQTLYDIVVLTQEIIDFTDPIDNVAPTDIALSNSTISEKEGIGTVVGTLSTYDPNIGDTHTYSIIVDGDNKFEISGNNLRLKNLLDYDVATQHSVTIRSTDQGALFFDKQFTIYVQEQVGFVNDKATLFQGDTIAMDMSGPASNVVLPSNGAFTASVWVKKDNATPTPETPPTISGLAVWLDANDDTSIALSGGKVTQWSDRSGNANHATQPTGTNRPTLITNGYGNRNTIAFTDPEWLETTYAVNPSTTIFAVFKHNHTGVQPAGPVWMLNNSGNTNGFYPQWVDGNQYVGVGGATWLTKAGTFNNNQFYTSVVRYDAVAPLTELFVDGALNDSAVDFEDDVGLNFTLGRRIATNNSMLGEIAEVIIYDRAITPQERNDVEAYLNNKWVLGNDVDADKPLLDFGNMSLTYNQADKFKFNYLNGAVPSQLVAQNVAYGDNNYHNVVIMYNSVSQVAMLHVDGSIVVNETSVVMPARDATPIRIAGNALQTKFLDATVDEISFYNSVVSVIDIYNDGLAQDLLDNPSLPTPRAWIRMGDQPDDYLIPNGVYDRSGNGYDFTANNMSNSNIITDSLPVAIPYANTLSLPFNGIDQYGDTGITTDMTGSGDFSISVWYKGTSPSYIVSQAHTLGPYASDLIIGGGSAVFWLRAKTLGALASISDNMWHNLIMSWDSVAKTYEGFVDGVSIGTSAVVTGYGGVGTVSVSTRGDFTTSFNQGNVDELAFFNKALNVTEASEIYNAGVPINLLEHSAESNLTNYYRMGEDAGDNETTVIDQKGTSNMTLTNFLPNPYSVDVPS